MTESNFEDFSFQCKISQNCIEYKCNKITMEANIEYSNIDTKIPKAFFVLLRTSIDALKNKGYKYIGQLVTQDDWENFLKNDKWTIINEIKYPTMTCCVIKCEIDDALGCISRGLGLNNKSK